MTPLARFPTLDDAESALDWIGVEFGEGDDVFEGELAGDDRDLLEAAIDDVETPAARPRPRPRAACEMGRGRWRRACVLGRMGRLTAAAATTVTVR